MARYLRCQICRHIIRTNYLPRGTVRRHKHRGRMCAGLYLTEPVWRAWPRMVGELLPGVLAGMIIVLLAGGTLWE